MEGEQGRTRTTKGNWPLKGAFYLAKREQMWRFALKAFVFPQRAVCFSSDSNKPFEHSRLKWITAKEQKMPHGTQSIFKKDRFKARLEKVAITLSFVNICIGKAFFHSGFGLSESKVIQTAGA